MDLQKNHSQPTWRSAHLNNKGATPGRSALWPPRRAPINGSLSSEHARGATSKLSRQNTLRENVLLGGVNANRRNNATGHTADSNTDHLEPDLPEISSSENRCSYAQEGCAPISYREQRASHVAAESKLATTFKSEEDGGTTTRKKTGKFRRASLIRSQLRMESLGMVNENSSETPSSELAHEPASELNLDASFNSSIKNANETSIEKDMKPSLNTSLDSTSEPTSQQVNTCTASPSLKSNPRLSLDVGRASQYMQIENVLGPTPTREEIVNFRGSKAALSARSTRLSSNLDIETTHSLEEPLILGISRAACTARPARPPIRQYGSSSSITSLTSLSSLLSTSSARDNTQNFRTNAALIRMVSRRGSLNPASPVTCDPTVSKREMDDERTHTKEAPNVQGRRRSVWNSTVARLATDSISLDNTVSNPKTVANEATPKTVANEATPKTAADEATPKTAATIDESFSNSRASRASRTSKMQPSESFPDSSILRDMIETRPSVAQEFDIVGCANAQDSSSRSSQFIHIANQLRASENRSPVKSVEESSKQSENLSEQPSEVSSENSSSTSNSMTDQNLLSMIRPSLRSRHSTTMGSPSTIALEEKASRRESASKDTKRIYNLSDLSEKDFQSAKLPMPASLPSPTSASQINGSVVTNRVSQIQSSTSKRTSPVTIPSRKSGSVARLATSAVPTAARHSNPPMVDDENKSISSVSHTQPQAKFKTKKPASVPNLNLKTNSTKEESATTVVVGRVVTGYDATNDKADDPLVNDTNDSNDYAFTISLFVDEIPDKAPAIISWSFKKGFYLRLTNREPRFYVQRGFCAQVTSACTRTPRPYYGLNVAYLHKTAFENSTDGKGERSKQIQSENSPSRPHMTLLYRVYYTDAGKAPLSRFDLVVRVRVRRLQTGYGFDELISAHLCGMNHEQPHAKREFKELALQRPRDMVLMFTPELFRSISRPRISNYWFRTWKKTLALTTWRELGVHTDRDWIQYQRIRTHFLNEYRKKINTSMGSLSS